ncbi:LCP family protein, partial [Candidatus Margulisiibacteriota bacterium]
GVNILAVGIDDTKYVQRSDTILVFHFDVSQNRIGIISIPRDTRVDIPGVGISKINHAFAYGKMDLLKETVINFLNIPIHNYIQINLKGVKNIIDQLGGITITIDKDLHYVDNAGNLFIDFKKGTHSLTGEEAISYLRFRQDKEGDIGRINRQQNFLKTLLIKIMNSGNIIKKSTLMRKLSKNFITDLSIREIIGLASQVNKVYHDGTIKTGTIPGAIILHNKISYWKPDIIGTDKIIDRILFSFETAENTTVRIETPDETAVNENRRKLTITELNRLETISETAHSYQDISKQLILEVLNGNGDRYGARIGAKFFKEKGFKVAWFGNAASFDYEHTMLVDWKGNVDKVVTLANLLCIDPSQIIIYHKPEKKLDVTIVLGHDWENIVNKIENIAQHVE